MYTAATSEDGALRSRQRARTVAGQLHNGFRCVVGGIRIQIGAQRQIVGTKRLAEQRGRVSVGAHRMVGRTGARDQGHHFSNLRLQLCDLCIPLIDGAYKAKKRQSTLRQTQSHSMSPENT